MPSNAAVAALNRAVKGLTYESETDAPFEAFRWRSADVGTALTEKRVLVLGGHARGESIEQQSLDEFFAPLVRHQDWHGVAERKTVEQYQALRTVIDKKLADARVYKVGSVERTIYIVGRTDAGDWAGDWAGVKTTAVET